MSDRAIPKGPGWRARIAGSGAVVFALIAMSVPGRALDEPPGEMAALKACEKRLCTMILDKEPAGDDLKCDVQKTWAKSTLEGGKSQGISWGFGDARCAVDLKLERSDIIAALTKPKHTVRVPAHQVNCVLEREGEIKPVTVKLAPKLTFKSGKAEKVWINLESIEGPEDVKSTIWAAAQLEDSLGIFHRPMIKSINKFMLRKCAKRYGPDAKADQDTADDDTKPDSKKTKVAAEKAAKSANKAAEDSKPERPAKASASEP